MQRICCYCKKDMGEKCRKCGGQDIHVLPKHYGAASDAVILNCRTCGHTWGKGSEPVSHGICDPPCAEAVKAGVGRSGSHSRESGNPQL
jgi:hypothetical protein